MLAQAEVALERQAEVTAAIRRSDQLRSEVIGAVSAFETGPVWRCAG